MKGKRGQLKLTGGVFQSSKHAVKIVKATLSKKYKV